ncbi:MAG: hypothetical protein IJS09_10875 [Treponema sp.]|nr:hypothetical protein [Treponema sp.]
MATNIEKDLHSVYIDNELPPAYIDKYEALVQSDAESAAEQSKMKKLHALMQEDAKDITVDDAFLEASFARLQTKMKYHQTMAQVNADENKPKIYQFARWGVSFAAAAAVFALIFTPVYLRSTNKSPAAAVSAIANTKLKPLAQNDIAVDGNIDRAALSSIAVNSSAIQGATMTSTATNQRTRAIELNDSLTSIDVFRPASASSENGLSIRIQISPMHDIRGEEEIIIPLPNISRQVQDR